MTNEEFDRIRREHEITSVQIAHHAGASVKELLQVETCRAPVQSWMITSLNELIAMK